MYSELEEPTANQKGKNNQSSPTKSTHSNKSSGGYYEEIDDSKVKRQKEQDSGFEGNYDVVNDDDTDDNVDRDIKSASLLGLPARSDDESSVMEEFDEVKSTAINTQKLLQIKAISDLHEENCVPFATSVVVQNFSITHFHQITFMKNNFEQQA